MRTLLTSVALIALAAAGAAYGDDTAPTSTPPAAAAPTEARPAVELAEAAPSFLARQTADQRLATNFIGAKLYNPENDELGTVNDVVLNGDGGVAALVVSVGGFLGIGEKSIAVSFDAVTAITNDDGSLKLVVATDKDRLVAAPDFQTLKMLKQQELVKSAPAAPSN